jgi:hypothetical protein
MIIISIRLAVEEVDAVIVPLEPAAMAVHNVKYDCDAVDMAQINQNLELGRCRGNVFELKGWRFPFGGEKLVERLKIRRQVRCAGNKGKIWREEIRTAVAESRVLFLLVDREGLQDIGIERGNVGNLARDIE